MTKENITTNLESVSAEAVTFKLEDWKPSKETSLQNQAYCSVQRMNIKFEGLPERGRQWMQQGKTH